MRLQIEQAVIEILAAQALLSPDDIAADSRLEDLGLDSLGKVEAIFALEERFDISIPFNANVPEAPDFDTSSVQSIVAAVESLIAQQAA
ncbi:phosphopantetheine-binding protein [Tabrizicola sp.]|uniref:acyl carrier protein n=1 Tax=Tabrizicola sp. TaxID=2005166 RepID=UPI00286C12E8|nr:phosphopantetheine-binding protein [Tabrizicola sp.]